MGQTQSDSPNTAHRKESSRINDCSKGALTMKKISATSCATMPSHSTNEASTNKSEKDDGAVIEALSDEARDILRATWNNDFSELYDLGTDIYSETFRLDPSVKKLFKCLDGYDLENDPTALRQCAAFSRQALRFIQTISMAVQNSGRLRNIESYLKDIGRRHVQYKRDGFDPKYWHVFETAITNVMQARAAANSNLTEEQKQILAQSYRSLACHLIAVMTDGFREQEIQQGT